MTEIEILIDLLSGLENDKWTLDYIHDKHNRASQSCEIILQIMRDVKESNKLKGEQFAVVNYITNFYPAKGAYESLQTIGLNIITI